MSCNLKHELYRIVMTIIYHEVSRVLVIFTPVVMSFGLMTGKQLS